MYSTVVKVTPAADFSLVVVFDNGETRVLDMRKYLNVGVFRKISDPEAFNRVHVAFDTVEWDCGVDLDPEFVMKRSILVE